MSKLLLQLVWLAVVGCGSSESEPESEPAPSGSASGESSAGVAGWAPWAVSPPRRPPAPTDAPPEAEAELERIAGETCACTDDPCAVAANLKLSDFLGRYEGRLKNLGALPAMVRTMNCFAALSKKSAAAPGPPDAGPPVAVTADAAAPVAAIEPARPPGITDAHVARLDRMMATLNRMRDEVTRKDCKAAARAVTRHWRGFKPVLEVFREVNPGDDADINAWLQEEYLRPAFGAIGELVNKGIDGCDQVDAWNRAVEKTDFMGSKNRGR